MGCYYPRSEKPKNVRKRKDLFFVKMFFVEYDLLKLMFVKIWEDEIWSCYPFGQIKLDERLYFYHYLATPIVKIDTQCSTAYLCGLQDIKICLISLDFLERSWGIFFFEKSDRTISIFLRSGKVIFKFEWSSWKGSRKIKRGYKTVENLFLRSHL